MPVCRFFLQGNCKFGDRCYNEHPRGGHQSKRYEEDYSGHSWQGNKYNEYDHQERYKHQSSYRDNSYKNQDYRNQHHSPMTRSYQQFGQNESYQANWNSRDREKTPKQDKYHWSRENRFAALDGDKNPDTDVDNMLSTIKSDVQTWTESKMWPFSCYSFQKGVGCLDGLPDISPEELRVLACLHPADYSNIVSEIETNYCGRKDELFQMNDATKSNLIAQMHVTENNPSQNLKISALYGPGFNFTERDDGLGVKNESASSPQTQFSFKLPDQAHTSDTANVTTFGSFNTPTTEKVQNISVFGSTSSKKSGHFHTADDVYTNIDLLTDNEKKKFEADRFTIGEIPVRPPSENYCR